MDPMNPNAEAIYDEQISPLMTKIIDICKEHRIPMLCSFQYSDDTDPNGPGFCTTRLPFGGEHPVLARALEVVKAQPTLTAITISTVRDK